MNKCYKCLFEGEFRDMGASMSVCNRCDDLMSAISAYESKEPCKWHITLDELITLQEKAAAKEGTV